MEYLHFLDGIRAIAVISVVLFHLDALFVPNGFLGVDIFFVISGFIVSYTASRRTSLGLFQFFIDFYARRFQRIFPALVVCLLITGIASALFIPSAWLSNDIDNTGKFAFFGLSNFYLSRGTDYFSPVTDFNPFTHTWSLGVEEQFYVLFPFLFFPWVASKGWKRISAAGYGIGLVMSLAVWLYLTRHKPLEAFYLIHARFWELAVGVLCFQLSQVLKASGDEKGGRYLRLLTNISLGTLVFSLFFVFPKQYEFASNLLAVFSTATLIYCLQTGQVSSSRVKLALEAPTARYIGQISYSLYLWHWPVFVLFRWTVGLVTPFQMVAASIITVLLSVASYRFVERPVRQSAILKSLPRWGVVVAGVVSVGLAWQGFEIVRRNKSDISMSVVVQDRGDWYPDIKRSRFSDLPECALKRTPSPLGVVYTRIGCDPATDPMVVYMLGDSHSGAAIPMLQRFTVATGIQSIWVNTNGCPVFSFNWLRDADPTCRRAVDKQIGAVSEIAKPGDVVFLPSLRMPRIGNQYFQRSDQEAIDEVFGKGSDERRLKSVDYATSMLQALGEKGVNIVFQAPPPILRSPPFRCSDWFNRSNVACKDGLTIERSFVDKLRQPILDSFVLVKSKIPLVSVWDPVPVLCPGSTCSATLDGRPLYFDGDHLSDFADAILVPSFVEAIKSLPK